MKAFLVLIINMGLLSLPDIKDYGSGEWITQITVFGDGMSRDRFQQIFWMMHVGNNTIEESSRAIERTKKVHGVIEYIEIRFQKHFAFSLYALLAPIFREKQLAQWLYGDLNSP
jgi:hypothetical protein